MSPTGQAAQRPGGPAGSTVVNALTIDVEDYFHVSAFESVCDPCTWPGRECRVEANTSRILRILDERSVKATFFVLGWVAERFPSLVRAIAASGHEVASHGYGHRRVYTQTREEFREDVRRAKGLLEDVSGAPVRGYRAPSYSISPSCLWAFDELVEAGHEYDSSVFPVRHDLYGIAEWPRFPFRLERMDGEGQGNWVPVEGEDAWQRGGLAAGRLTQEDPGTSASKPPGGPAAQRPSGQGRGLLEIPITTLRLLGRNLPIAGGGYFRLFPYAFSRWGLRTINEGEGRPFVFYLHPWELDPEQPRIEGAGLKSRLRHYLNLERAEARFRQLLEDFRFGSLADAVGPGARGGASSGAAGNGVPQGAASLDEPPLQGGSRGHETKMRSTAIR